MDFSALTEAQQQQLIAQHQQQQAQQQQQPVDPSQQASQPYDPSQAYDQSAQAYYYPQSYQNPTSQDHQQYQQQNPYPYYPPEYANATANNSYQQPSQQDSNIQPPGVSNPQEASQILAAATVAPSGNAPAQQNAYYPQEQQSSSYQVPPGLNPAAAAAVAALSQLTQFAGTMDAAERAMAGIQERPAWPGKNEGGYGHMGGHHQPHPHHHPVHHGGINVRPPPAGRSPYRGGGPFRGGSRGNFGHHYPRPDGGPPHFRGRGRMARGGGRRFSRPSPASPSPYPAPISENPSAPSAAPAVAPPTQMKAPGKAQAPRPEPSRPPLVAWCELCMVDCNSLEILEQHNNGKRHKKNVQRYEELQNHKKLMAEAQAKAQEQPQNVQVSEENKAPNQENLPDAAATAENKMETHQPDQQNQTAEQPEDVKVESAEAPTRRPRTDRYDRRHAPKRKMKFGRGGKRMRMSEVRSNPAPARAPAPKESPKYCALCHVTCDTQAVFDCHLAGKKHTSRAKRSQGPGIYGLGLHAVYVPHVQPAVTPHGQNQQAFYGPQGQEHQSPLLTSYENHQAQQNGQPIGQEVVGGSEDQNVGARQPEGQSADTIQPDSENAAMVKPEGQDIVSVEPEDKTDITVPPEDQMGGGGEPEGQNGIAVESEGRDAVTVETTDPNAIMLKLEDPNNVSESKTMDFSVPDNSISVSENTKTGAEQVFPSTNHAVLAPEFGVSSTENVVLQGPKINDGDPVPNEEPTTQDMASQ